MRALDSSNPQILRPSSFASFSAIVPLLCVIFSLPLASGAASEIAFFENPIVVILLALGAAFLLIIPVPIVFRWDWKACYYGFSLLCLGGISLLAAVPLLSVVLYGRAPIYALLVILFLYGISHFLWCRKFVVLYRGVFSDDNLRIIIYQEENDAVYYMRRGDEFLLRKRYKFSQIPSDWLIGVSVGSALLMAVDMHAVAGFIGLPFVHAFLIIAMIPISCIGAGIATRGFLLFYLFPAKIKKITGKTVYVDVVGKYRSNNK